MCLSHTNLILDNKIMEGEKNLTIHTDFLEFVTVEFKLNLAFIQLFISSY